MLISKKTWCFECNGEMHRKPHKQYVDYICSSCKASTKIYLAPRMLAGVKYYTNSKGKTWEWGEK